MIKCFWVLFLICTLAACNSAPEKIERATMRGRETEASIYSYATTSEWMREDGDPTTLSDTMNPLCTFFIKDPEGQIKITFHTFTSESLETRIPALAQIQRWKQQLKNKDEQSVARESWGGFYGYHLNGDEMIGWAMQIAPEHYYALSRQASDETTKIYHEMRADFTIKATGPPSLLEKYRADITYFAHSLELIHDIPER